MRKRLFAMFLTLFAAMGFAACGREKVETREVEYDMTFENHTGSDVSGLEIRYAADADWMSISLKDGVWGNNYRIPVSMKGKMPVAKDGWQVRMVLDGVKDAVIWEGVEFKDAEVITFSLDQDGDPITEFNTEDAGKEILYGEGDTFHNPGDTTSDDGNGDLHNNTEE